jgi:hypothetical protein
MASGVALLLAVGSAVQVLVDLIVNLSAKKAAAPTMGVKFLRLAGDIADVIPILLVAATVVLVAMVMVGADARRTTAALVIAGTAAVVAVLILLALLMSFGSVAGHSIAGLHPWQTRIHLLLGAIAAFAAAALANDARDRA